MNYTTRIDFLPSFATTKLMHVKAPLNIAALSIDQLAKLRTKGGTDFRFGFIADTGTQPVYGWVKIGGDWVANNWSLNGHYFAAVNAATNDYDLTLDPAPVAVKGPIYFRLNSATEVYPSASSDNRDYVGRSCHGVAQAIVKIVDFSEVKKGEGLTPGTEPKFKLVRV